MNVKNMEYRNQISRGDELTYPKNPVYGTITGTVPNPIYPMQISIDLID